MNPAGKSLPGTKPDETPTDNISSLRPSEELGGRSSADNSVESLKQALADVKLADLTQNELRELHSKLLNFREKLAQRAEVLRGTGKARED